MQIKRLIFFLFALFVSGLTFLNLYPDFLWFQSFDYASVWWFRVRSELITWAIFTSIAYLWLSTHMRFANRNSQIASRASSYDIQTPFPFLNQIIAQFRRYMENSNESSSMTQTTYTFFLKIAVVVLSVIFGLSAKTWWEDLYLYLNQTAYGLQDPLFGKDIAFYFFNLPLLNHMQNWFTGLFIASLALVAWVYFSRNILLVVFSKNSEFSAIKRHLLILLSLTFILLSVGTWLAIYDLVLGHNGVVHGAAFIDVNVILPVKQILVALFALEAVLILVLIIQPSFKLPYIGLAILVLVHVVGLRLAPNIIQSVFVAPNELVKEAPYIQSNINFTREAYDLTQVKEQDFPVNYNLSGADIKSNQTIVENIRLWNQEPLKQTFSQLQEIRLYYEFGNVDVDRYEINGKPQQVMLSARELDSNQLTAQAQTWTNRHLVYTHGYGLCMTPVNEVTEDGLPEFFVKDLPPVARHGLNVTRPEIYFGEKTTDYVIVNTRQDEFDFPKGDLNVYTHYEGDGGIVLDSFFKRLLFSIKFSDFKILFSSQIKPDSRLMYDRLISTIPRKIAPFLIFDKDPYLVLSDTGRMKWVLDAYTTSRNFPYSEPFNRKINYIRNSVKIVLDAYSGKVDFYVVDNKDPLINAYSKVYTGLFKQVDSMPAFVKKHVKYPKDLFTVQALMLNTYHMEDTQVFYNREDLWEFPQETYEGSEKTMSPYYIVTKLPGQTKESFVLMLPFTPTNKNNMIAWLAASSDFDTYGDFTVLKLPKEKTIYGPMQIESRIDQDTEISKDLTLWGQMGSRVIRGNLMIIPIEDSLLYVEPIYLQAETSKLPELKRVIVSYQDKVVMENNLMDAIFSLFDVREYKSSASISDSVTLKMSSLKDISRVFNAMKQTLSKSQWEKFGLKMAELEALINNAK